MKEEHEELFGQYIAEFASEHDIQLDDDGIMKAIELFDECSHRWKSDLSTSIYEMAKDLDFNEMDEDIVEMVSVVWKRIYSNLVAITRSACPVDVIKYKTNETV